jgi:hypothetical protein
VTLFFTFFRTLLGFAIFNVPVNYIAVNNPVTGLLLSLNRTPWPLTGARVRFGTLATQRQTATVTDSTIATQVHQALDVHGHFTSKVALDRKLGDFGTKRLYFTFGQVLNLCIFCHTRGLADTSSTGRTDSIDLGQRNDSVLTIGNVDACNTGHQVTPKNTIISSRWARLTHNFNWISLTNQAKSLSLSLFMPGFFADNPHHAIAPDNLAVSANLLYRRPYFHDSISKNTVEPYRC